MVAKCPQSHPAVASQRGSGGGLLMRASTDGYRRDPLITVPGDMGIGAVLATLERHEISAAPVVSYMGTALGVVSRTDLLRAASSGYRSDALRGYSFERSPTTASEIMHRAVVSVRGGASISEAAGVMTEHHVHRVFVLDERGAPCGVVGTREVMAAIGDARLESPIGTLTRRRPPTVTRDMSVALATSRLSIARDSGLVVVDAAGWPVGMFTQREALLARRLDTDATVDAAMSDSMLFMSPDTPVWRAAARAAETLARRVLVVEKARVAGVVAPLDFARVAALRE
jgi:CBS domain-containing protein